MNISEKRPFEERGPEDLSWDPPAKELIGEILHGNRPDKALLKLLGYIKRHIPGDESSLLWIAVRCLTANAYAESEVFYEQAESYADSLLEPAPVEPRPAAPQVDRFQKLTDTLADLIEDPSLPDAMRELLGAAAIEAVNIHGGHITSGRDTATFVRGFFARACEKAAAAEAPKSTRRRN